MDLLQVLLLFVMISQGGGQDGGQNIWKKSDSKICDSLMNEPFAEYHNVAVNGLQNVQDDLRHWQRSKESPHGFLLDALESCRCLCVHDAQLQEHPPSPPTAEAKKFTSYSSMLSKSKTKFQSAFKLSKDVAYGESPPLLLACRRYGSLISQHSTVTFALLSLHRRVPSSHSVCSLITYFPVLEILSGAPSSDQSSSPRWFTSEHFHVGGQIPSQAKVLNLKSHDQIDLSFSAPGLSHSAIVTSEPLAHHYPKSGRHHFLEIPPVSPRHASKSSAVPDTPKVPPDFTNASHMAPVPVSPSVPDSPKVAQSVNVSRLAPIGSPPSPLRPISHPQHKRHHNSHHPASPESPHAGSGPKVATSPSSLPHHRHHSASPPASPPAGAGSGPKAATSPSPLLHHRQHQVSSPAGAGPKEATAQSPMPHMHGHSGIPIGPFQGHGAVPPLAPRKVPIPAVANPPVTLPPSPPSEGHGAVPPLAPRKVPIPAVANPPMTLPPSPPSEDCGTLPCPPPFTKTPLMAPCGCVRPIQVEIELSVALYALFPLISMLAAELADGTVLSQNQVEIMGANANGEDQDKSIVDINLVPLDEGFDNLTALLIFQKLWNHEVLLNATLFGNYSVVYVHYPGLPPSPPSSETNRGTLNGTFGASSEQPFGVDVSKKTYKFGTGAIAVITLSIAVVICLGAIKLVILKCSHSVESPPLVECGLLSARTKKSGSILSSDVGTSTSVSFASGIVTYASTARTFTFADLDRATNKFRPENIIGEGGFGRVYSGILDDGTKVAVKVLTRDDQQGGKEFIAEVEMLSRLHHRNLVKLIGICAEEQSRCLVYELIPNGSVESHLHGVDKEASQLNWDARMKIALGAARGLAYLHEDSNPRVIHRDFKASNILLENDFNPKVSDFGLAKAAPDEESGHIFTRVMGTFGYVAPEYAMTGHLLVKSDVYSYGVVLLELLSGRKPVDMSQPPGQENLVTWARPLLASKVGLEILVDPALRSNFPFNNLARVAAIASMCVQPEVSHRPFMGEVVQALKLVCNDADINDGSASTNESRGDDSPADCDPKAGQGWPGSKVPSASDISMDYDSGPSSGGENGAGRLVSASAFVYDSTRLDRHTSLRRHSLSGPVITGSTLEGFKLSSLGLRSPNEHPLATHFGTGLDRDWP